jgi:hypothetical protein
MIDEYNYCCNNTKRRIARSSSRQIEGPDVFLVGLCFSLPLRSPPQKKYIKLLDTKMPTGAIGTAPVLFKHAGTLLAGPTSRLLTRPPLSPAIRHGSVLLSYLYNY